MKKHFGMPTTLMFRAVALTLRARLRRREAQARKRAALIIAKRKRGSARP
jgi:hypothetical protein